MMVSLWKQTAAFLTVPLLLCFLFSPIRASESLPPPCDSLIYCHGQLLRTVQLAEIFDDSKHFVDMPMKNSPEVTLENFEKLMNDTKDNPSQQQVRDFVETNFLEPGSEFVKWNPTDWNPNPDFLKNIVDPELEEWAKNLNKLWKRLGRQTSDDVSDLPEKYSLIHLPNPVIVPGGRFREVYYWDSYWTIEGLLLSGMHTTAKGMLENFLRFIQEYGMVPNGGRIYYTRRSQPPYLISMVKLYVDYTNDTDFAKKNIGLLEKEFQFWESNRTTPVRDTKTGKVRHVLQYNVHVADPRPESYKEDFNLAENLASNELKQHLYIELKSGAESGWDYSTRWFVKGDSNKAPESATPKSFLARSLSTVGKYVSSFVYQSPPNPDCVSPDSINNDSCNEGELTDLGVTAIAPVDLNSLHCRNARILSDFHKLFGNSEEAAKYDEIATDKNQTLADLFWDEGDGIWYDLNIKTMKKRKFFYLSNVHPIWSGSYGFEGKREDTLKKVLKYLTEKKVVDYIGGVPTSLKDSGEQWDFPNAWAPLQHLVIMGLYNASSINPDAEALSFELAEKWVRTNFLGYKETNHMYEKYDVNVEGIAGGGGEYDVQEGFGWTNGVAMKLLDTFGDRLTATTGGGAEVEFYSVASFLPTVVMIFISTRRDL